jgi:hypothetical protein
MAAPRSGNRAVRIRPNAGNPVYPSGTRLKLCAMGSENPNGADNQQERLIELGWVLGFVDGEGCFSIGFVRQSGGRGRSGYRTGWQVAHEFAVTQGASSIECLHELVDFFGVGMVIVNRRHDNHKEPLHRYVVRSRLACGRRSFRSSVPIRFERRSVRTSRSSRTASISSIAASISTRKG